MSLKDIQIKHEYRSVKDNMAAEFYIPLLEEAVDYKRAVGFFSSTALVEISKGISQLIKNGGKMQLICSPYLSDEDVEAMREGYKKKSEIIENSLFNELEDARDWIEESRLNLVANLISDGLLDIRIALTEKHGELGMYHEKMGVITDKDNNKVAFSGSMNESYTAMNINYEAIDVFKSWRDIDDRVATKEQVFNNIWTGSEDGIKTIELPELTDEIVKRYKNSMPDFDIDKKEAVARMKMFPEKELWIKKPDFIKFFNYQEMAMERWKEQKFKGIFDMATGTGKTYTALGALEVLCQEMNSNLGVFIVCPYQHLVEQWVEDIKLYGIEPLICYSGYDWKKKYRSILSDFRLGIIKNFCVITTNTTFAMEYMQKEIDKLKGNVCLVVDEAHNFGAKKQLECMKEVFKYRLALSATLKRHNDEIGTLALETYFGEKCIEYTLQQAIEENKLTPYYYYPIPITLEEDELEEYEALTEKIRKMMLNSKNKDDLPKSVEVLLIQRARIIAGARNKLSALYNIIESGGYKDDNQMLVYCGATTVESMGYEEGNADNTEKRQIEVVMDMLGNKLGMRVTKFTSEENAQERELIKKSFSEGSMLQAVIAIRCLDEGVNIPGIKTAFILASSTNPKEYIQRRGRVLRKAKNKPFAKIYDFITLPRKLEDVEINGQKFKSELSLIKREFERVKDFAQLAENTFESTELQYAISDAYGLDYIKGEEYEY